MSFVHLGDVEEGFLKRQVGELRGSAMIFFPCEPLSYLPHRHEHRASLWVAGPQ